MTNSFSESSLPKRVNEGSPSAAFSVDRRYRQQLIALVAGKLGRRFAQREDPEDVVQSAMRSFFRGVEEKRFQVDSTGALWKLLETTTRHKVLRHVERNTTAKKGVHKAEQIKGRMLAPAPGPLPEEATHLADVIERALEGLEATDAEVFFHRLEEFTVEEIGARFHCMRSMIRTKLGHIQRRLEVLLDEAD